MHGVLLSHQEHVTSDFFLSCDHGSIHAPEHYHQLEIENIHYWSNGRVLHIKVLPNAVHTVKEGSQQR